MNYALIYRFSTCFYTVLLLSIVSCSAKPPLSQSPPTPSPSVSPSKAAIPTALKTQKSSSKVVLPGIDPLEVEGNLVISGSNTVYPITTAMYQQFIADGYANEIEIDNTSSGEGFQRFCKDGKADIVVASRAIKESEVQACNAISRQPVAFRIGTDAIVVVVHPDNYFLNRTTVSELARIFTAEKWSDVQPRWSREAIQHYMPDEKSGTLDFFVEKVLKSETNVLRTAPSTRINWDIDELAQNISTDSNGIGFFNYAYYQKYSNSLKALSIDGINPNSSTIKNNTYPLTRPLFLYSDAQLMQKKPQVAAFINYFLNHVDEEITKVGYFQAESDELDKAKSNYLRAMRNER